MLACLKKKTKPKTKKMKERKKVGSEDQGGGQSHLSVPICYINTSMCKQPSDVL